jgi:hypothetical protein
MTMARSPYEIEGQKQLESEGWRVDYKIRPRICPRGYKVDFFGLFDLLAYKENNPVRWIAIKGVSGNYAILRRELEKFPMGQGHLKELWRFTKGKKGFVKKETIA